MDGGGRRRGPTAEDHALDQIAKESEVSHGRRPMTSELTSSPWERLLESGHTLPERLLRQVLILLVSLESGRCGESSRLPRSPMYRSTSRSFMFRPGSNCQGDMSIYRRKPEWTEHIRPLVESH
ncbi:unnamed protein product [Nezara viridula]|nr:unnamed protein product [Nezara viridula]